jgi:hypothetical protein
VPEFKFEFQTELEDFQARLLAPEAFVGGTPRNS